MRLPLGPPTLSAENSCILSVGLFIPFTSMLCKRGGTLGGILSRYFFDFLRYELDFSSSGWFFISKPCFLSFSTQNHAESSRNFVTNSFLNPKRVKFDQKSWFGHVWTCPGGQVLTANQRKYLFQKLHIYIFTSKFIILYKIMCFIKHIYHFV